MTKNVKIINNMIKEYSSGKIDAVNSMEDILIKCSDKETMTLLKSELPNLHLILSRLEKKLDETFFEVVYKIYYKICIYRWEKDRKLETSYRIDHIWRDLNMETPKFFKVVEYDNDMLISKLNEIKEEYKGTDKIVSLIDERINDLESLSYNELRKKYRMN